MEAAALAIITAVTAIGIGITSQSEPNYPKEKANLTPSQAQVIADHLTGYISQQFPPAQTTLSLVHRNSTLSTEMEQSLRDQGYAVLSNETEKMQSKITYATDYLDDTRIIIQVDVGKNFDLTGIYHIENDAVVPVTPFTVKAHD